MSSTFDAYKQFDSKRAERFTGLEQASEVFDSLGCSDLTSVLTIMSDVRATEVSPNSVVTGNRFHEASPISQRDFHWIDGVIMDAYDSDVDMVELSPLQPFGTNKVLAGTSQKNVVSALRNSEATADIATALFRIAFERLGKDRDAVESVSVASSARIARAQMYGKNSKFLPHFRMFGEVTVGSREQELHHLTNHLGSKVNVISTIAGSERSDIDSMTIKMGNLALLDDLIQRGIVDTNELQRNIKNPDYNVIRDQQLDVPEFLPLDTPALADVLKDLGFQRGVGVMNNMKVALEKHRPDLVPSIVLDLGRKASKGYYQHICYDVWATNIAGLTLPVAGGGSTDWAVKASGGKKIATVVSSISTELLCRNYFA